MNQSLMSYRGNRAFLGALCLLLAVILVGCGKEIRQDRTVVKKGLVYEMGSQKPFSGYVVGNGREGYRREAMRYEKRYRMGKLDGLTRYWYDNGQLESVEPYKDGVIDGVIKRYYENGQVKAKVHFVNGKRGGMRGEKFWDEDGRRKE